VVGGKGKKTSAEIWNPESNDWTSAGNTEVPRSDHAANLLNDGRVIVTGGTGAKASTEIYDPLTNSWSSGADMVEWRYRHVATTLDDGRILITGGNGKNEVLAEAELFIP
jgi:N-acetylneuraminic acid mutarotase